MNVFDGVDDLERMTIAGTDWQNAGANIPFETQEELDVYQEEHRLLNVAATEIRMLREIVETHRDAIEDVMDHAMGVSRERDALRVELQELKDSTTTLPWEES